MVSPFVLICPYFGLKYAQGIFYHELLKALVGEGYGSLAAKVASLRQMEGKIHLRDSDIGIVKGIEDMAMNM